MTATLAPPLTPAEVPPEPEAPSRVTKAMPAILRWAAAIGGALVVFSILLMISGVNPLQTYADMIASTFGNPRSVQEIFNQMAPLVLGALAVAIPARAGLTNVGGEGQIIMGGVGACGAFLLLGDSLTGSALIVAMLLFSVLAGALWAGIAAGMRLMAGVNEAITTLLLNFVALDVLLYLIYQPWRESSTGQPTTRELDDLAKLPVLSGTDVHIGIVIAVVLAGLTHVLLNNTRWGFKISVVGGNAEAARRSGMKVGRLLVGALLLGGALAGLAGMIVFAGVEYKLRPGFGNQLGYTAFLACWLARHQPFPILLACFVFASLSVAGDSLQLDAGLPAASINVLTALILIAVLGFTSTRKKAN